MAKRRRRRGEKCSDDLSCVGVLRAARKFASSKHSSMVYERAGALAASACSRLDGGGE